MAITAADVSVAINGNIRWEGAGAGDGPYTVLELHRYLQDLADQAQASGDDLIDITSSTPSERSTDNIITLLGSYNIDAEMAQHLYNGSITQASGDEVYSGLVVVGAVNAATTLMIIQDEALYDDGVHTPSAPFWGTDLNADAGANILMRCMLLTRSGGTDVDGKRVRIQAREYGDTYAEFSLTLGLGNSTAAIFTNEDLNNATASGTVAGWSTITNQNEGYVGIDLGGGDGTKYYYSRWTRAGYTINQLYERAKYLTQRGSTTTDLYGIDGELFRGITHEVAGTQAGGTFSAYEHVTWATGAGEMYATNHLTASTKIWIQLTAGTAPTNTQVITATGGATFTTTSSTARTISPCFIGQSTGTALIGAYGIGVLAADLASTDKLFDLNNALQEPPNNVTFTLSGVVSGSDYVLVTNNQSTNIDYDQLTLSVTLSGGTETAVVVSAAIPSDTPSPSGTFRVQMDTGVYRKLTYTSYTGSTFTIDSTDFSGGNIATADNNVFISYIDELVSASSVSFTTIYNSDRSLFIRVRDGGATPIKTYETTGTLGSAGGTATATRTSDA